MGKGSGRAQSASGLRSPGCERDAWCDAQPVAAVDLYPLQSRSLTKGVRGPPWDGLEEDQKAYLS